MKRAAYKWLAACLVVLFFFPFSVGAIEVPKQQGDIYVQDFADLLTNEQTEQLNQLGRQLEDATTAQVAVLTIDSLGGESIEEFANEAFREYGIGSAESDNGVLLVIAYDDREVRIEVGYGLEGALPDGKVGRIRDEYLIPYLQADEPDQAIIETYKVLYNDIADEYGWDGEVSDVTPYEEATSTDNPLFAILIVVIIAFVVFLDMKFFGGILTHLLLSILFRGGGGGSGGGSSGGGHRGGGGGSSGGGGASGKW
ncbi:MAG: TPM domain-containing protein [Bacillus sp. (in: firmicutes)]